MEEKDAEYKALVEKLTEILCEIDLMNICDIPDEYEPEAETIAERLLVGREELSTKMLREVFEKWFFKDCCSDEEHQQAFEKIRKSLRSN